MKHATDFPRLVTETRHPTPAQIRAEITHQLMQDHAKHPIGGVVPHMPARTLGLIERAISEACRKHGEYQ